MDGCDAKRPTSIIQEVGKHSRRQEWSWVNTTYLKYSNIRLPIPNRTAALFDLAKLEINDFEQDTCNPTKYHKSSNWALIIAWDLNLPMVRGLPPIIEWITVPISYCVWRADRLIGFQGNSHRLDRLNKPKWESLIMNCINGWIEPEGCVWLDYQPGLSFVDLSLNWKLVQIEIDELQSHKSLKSFNGIAFLIDETHLIELAKHGIELEIYLI